MYMWVIIIKSGELAIRQAIKPEWKCWTRNEIKWNRKQHPKYRVWLQH